ncbi:MAG: DUF2452 domain-containing protein [Bacteroidota bacterium]
MGKKPDNVVFNEITKSYDASLKEYGTNLSAPVIRIESLGPWKTQGIQAVNNNLSAEFEELKQKYMALQERYRYNQLVYASDYNFKPSVGKTYHLYNKVDGKTFLSILGPEECNFDFVASFRLDSNLIWERVDRSTK